MKIKYIACLIAAASLLFFAGCERPATTEDKTNPEITVFVSGARGRNYFRSIDGVMDPPDNCIIVRQMPTQLIMIAGDAGGIQLAGIKAFTGTISRDTVAITPAAPEGAFSITTDRGADTLEIRLTPPSPTTVRTGATAAFEVNGPLPMAITAWARDRAGNYAELPQFDLRSPETAANCRGE